MRSVVIGLAGLVSLGSVVSAEAHQCYRRVADPAQYRTVAEQVLVSPEREVAEYVPAVTRQVEETVIVRPEQEVTRVIPAQYGYQDETVLVSPARREWRTRDEDGQLIGCWVTVPATYAHRATRVLVREEQEVTQTIPAETATRVRTEVVEPAHTVTHVIPARYATREREELVSTGGAHWAPIEQSCEH